MNRSDIIDVLGISRRTTFNKQKRACAYGFPLSAFNRGGRPTDSERSERSSVTADTDTGEADGQQRLDAVPDKDPDSLGRTETWGAADSESEAQSTGVDDRRGSQTASDDVGSEELQAHLQEAIDALRDVNEVCSWNGLKSRTALENSLV